jgi:hypothetical protein
MGGVREWNHHYHVGVEDSDLSPYKGCKLITTTEGPSAISKEVKERFS